MKKKTTFVLVSTTSVISRREQIEIYDEMMITDHICLADVCQTIDSTNKKKERDMRLSLSSHLIICYSSFLFVCMISNNSIFIYIYMQKKTSLSVENLQLFQIGRPYAYVSLCTFIIVFLIKYKTKTYPLGKENMYCFDQQIINRPEQCFILLLSSSSSTSERQLFLFILLLLLFF